MPFAIVAVIIAAALHLGLHLPIGFAIVVAVIGTAILWIVWKAKWLILGILGLETLFGGGGDDA